MQLTIVLQIYPKLRKLIKLQQYIGSFSALFCDDVFTTDQRKEESPQWGAAGCARISAKADWK